MKLIHLTKDYSARFKHKYSIWFNPDGPIGERIIYASSCELNFRVLFKLRSISGSLYIQHEAASTLKGNAYLDEYDKLLRVFVDKKK